MEHWCGTFTVNKYVSMLLQNQKMTFYEKSCREKLLYTFIEI